MPQYLLAVSIGPVQGFIAAARRTRDFWMGSTILGNAARTAARSVVEAFGNDVSRLIFPSVNEHADLLPVGLNPQQGQAADGPDVSNIILCRVDFDSSEAVLTFVRELEDTVHGQFSQTARQAAQLCSRELRPDYVHRLQDRVLEVYAAWVLFDDPAHYAVRRRDVMRLLAGRKACRDFEPWNGAPQLLKSSLDGARETVLRRLEEGQKRRHQLRVKGNEQLDLVGVMKRVEYGNDAIRYPSVSRVAVDPFVRGAEEAAKADKAIADLWKSVRARCDELRKLGALRKRSTASRGESDFGKFPWLKSFPFEGTPLYLNRHREIVKELSEELDVEDEANEQDVLQVLDQLKGTLGKLQSRMRVKRPFEYVAFLCADGDGMGKALSEIAKLPDGLEQHRAFSKQQADFANQARNLINDKYRGACFYASADDILGMVPVDQCLACADDLRSTFRESLKEFAGVSLSIGIAIGHFLEPLEDLLEFARDAEKRAKNPAPEDRRQQSRNALALAIHPRGGASFAIRDNWNSGIVERLKIWTHLHFEQQISTKAAYDLRGVAEVFGSTPGDFVRQDALRVLRRKQERSTGDTRSAKQEIEQGLQNVQSGTDLQVVAHELLVGQWLASARRQAEESARQPREELQEVAP